MNGCSAIGPALEVGSAGLSAAGAYFSYQALNADPVEVTVLARECVVPPRYIRVDCEARAHVPEEILDAIAAQNAANVALCGIERPEPLVCQ